MKKKYIYLFIIVFFVLNITQIKADNYQTTSPYWSTEKNGPRSIDQAIKMFFKDRPLDPLEGVWTESDWGLVAITKSGNNYHKYLISVDYRGLDGTHETTYLKTTDSNFFTFFTRISWEDGNWYKFKTSSGTLVLKNENYAERVIDRYAMYPNGTLIRNWPTDLYAYNKQFTDSSQKKGPYWSNKKDGPTSIEEAKSKFDKRKLDIIEGIWLDNHKWSVGAVAIYKKNNSYRMHIVEGDTNFNGTWEGTIFKKENLNYDYIGRIWYPQDDGSYTFDTQKSNIKVSKSGDYFYSNYESLTKDGDDFSSKFTRIWPKDLTTYNNSLSSSENTTTNNTTDETTEKFYALNWYNLDNPKNHYAEIPRSNSEVNILESEIYLKGQKDIDEYTLLLFNHNETVGDMLIVDDSSYDYSIYIDYVDDGYVSLDDWQDVNPKKLLEQMMSTAKDNVKNVKWLIEPKIYENKHVTYSYEVSWKDGEKTLETKIIALGKKGYNDISFVTKDQNFSSNDLEKMAVEFANTVTFKEGFKHSDYKSGDKVAALGIGGLVAGTLGVKALAKAGILAKFLPLLAKFWWIIIAPLVAIFGFLGKNDTSKSSRRRKK